MCSDCLCCAQICNHPCLSYWPIYEYDRATLVHRCGKFRMLDRLLVKLHAGGHRVLLFSTMTKLLDLLEEYLRWRVIGEGGRRMGYLRIDGSTSLEDRCVHPKPQASGAQIAAPCRGRASSRFRTGMCAEEHGHLCCEHAAQRRWCQLWQPPSRG